MVWKSLRFGSLICVLAALLAQPIAASAASYTTYNEGNISSSYVTIFRDIVNKVPINEDYVFFRAGEYEYILVSGELEYSGGVFTGPVCTFYRIMTTNGYNAVQSLFQTEEIDFYLDPGNAIVYSNLGHYPDLIDRTSFFSFASLCLMMVALFMFLIRSIFSFVLRRR